MQLVVGGKRHQVELADSVFHKHGARPALPVVVVAELEACHIVSVVGETQFSEVTLVGGVVVVEEHLCVSNHRLDFERQIGGAVLAGAIEVALHGLSRGQPVGEHESPVVIAESVVDLQLALGDTPGGHIVDNLLLAQVGDPGHLAFRDPAEYAGIGLGAQHALLHILERGERERAV